MGKEIEVCVTEALIYLFCFLLLVYRHGEVKSCGTACHTTVGAVTINFPLKLPGIDVMLGSR